MWIYWKGGMFISGFARAFTDIVWSEALRSAAPGFKPFRRHRLSAESAEIPASDWQGTAFSRLKAASATCQACVLRLRPLGTVSLASWRTVPKFAQKLRLNVKLCMARGSRIQECTLRYIVLKWAEQGPASVRKVLQPNRANPGWLVSRIV